MPPSNDDPRYQFLDPARIEQLRAVSQTDSLIYDAMRWRIGNLLTGGGALLERKGNNGNTTFRITDSAFQSNMWEKWINDALPWIWTIGFAATQSVPLSSGHELDSEARVLDLTMLHV